jgi:hypothetical protein
MLKMVVSTWMALAVLLGAVGVRLAAAQGEPPGENTRAAWQLSNQLHRNQNQSPAGQQVQAQEQANSNASVGTQLIDRDRTPKQNNLPTQTQARRQIHAESTVTPAAPAKGLLDRDRLCLQEQLCTQAQDGLQQQDRLLQLNPTDANRNRAHYEALSCGPGHDN